MPEHTGVGECLEAAAEQVDWVKLYRTRRWRQGSPLQRRRVRRRSDGRTGIIINATYSHGTFAAPGETIWVAIEWDERREGEKRWQMGNENLAFCDVLAPPPLPPGAVRVRRVLFRGTKEQVQERLGQLEPLTDERLAAGESRYVEFDDQPAAYRRWRIVHVGAPIDDERARALPSEAPRAAQLRRDFEDAAQEGRDDAARDWAA